MKCSICQQEKTLQTLSALDDEGESYEIHLCDRCWDAIFAIATRAAEMVFLRKEQMGKLPIRGI